MKLVVGLGNPGEIYKNVRHNLGFMVVEELGRKIDGGKWKIGVEDGGWKLDKKFKSEILRIKDILFVKPLTYMNNSGQAVKLISDYYKIAPEDIIIIHDDLDLPLGKIKVRLGGAAAGHHGVESIIDVLETDQFIRVRLGIGNLRTLGAEHKIHSIGTEKFVLESFTHSEQSKVKHMVKQAVKAVELLLEKGLQQAQNQFN